jgi:hypothetical protein
MTEGVGTNAPVLLVASDIPDPQPLHPLRPAPDAFGFAMVLAPSSIAQPGLALLALPVDALKPQTHTACDHGELDALRRSVPAARALPLLQMLARGESGRAVLEGFADGALAIDVTVGAGAQ